jgi:hypothetical protein
MTDISCKENLARETILIDDDERKQQASRRRNSGDSQSSAGNSSIAITIASSRPFFAG